MGEMIQVKSRDGKSFAAYLALPKQASLSVAVPAAGIVLLPEGRCHIKRNQPNLGDRPIG
jgi:hypothetical protein